MSCPGGEMILFRGRGDSLSSDPVSKGGIIRMEGVILFGEAEKNLTFFWGVSFKTVSYPIWSRKGYGHY